MLVYAYPCHHLPIFSLALATLHSDAKHLSITCFHSGGGLGLHAIGAGGVHGRERGIFAKSKWALSCNLRTLELVCKGPLDLATFAFEMRQCL